MQLDTYTLLLIYILSHHPPKQKTTEPLGIFCRRKKVVEVTRVVEDLVVGNLRFPNREMGGACTPPKFNMEPQNNGFQMDFP